MLEGNQQKTVVKGRVGRSGGGGDERPGIAESVEGLWVRGDGEGKGECGASVVAANDTGRGVVPC